MMEPWKMQGWQVLEDHATNIERELFSMSFFFFFRKKIKHIHKLLTEIISNRLHAVMSHVLKWSEPFRSPETTNVLVYIRQGTTLEVLNLITVRTCRTVRL